MKKIGWLLGWAIPEAWFATQVQAVLPGAQHRFVRSTPQAFAQLEAAGPFDAVIGYSLGSLLLLGQPERATRLGRVGLLAPILAFPREKNLGGRIALAQVRQLARWIRRDPAAALADFYQRAGLDVTWSGPFSVVDLAELSWGLERLERDEAASLPEGWEAWCGADDPLIDAARWREIVPRVLVVPGGGHHPSALLRALAETMEKNDKAAAGRLARSATPGETP